MYTSLRFELRSRVYNLENTCCSIRSIFNVFLYNRLTEQHVLHKIVQLRSHFKT